MRKKIVTIRQPGQTVKQGELAILHALAGHREEALRLLAAAIDYGWRTDASFVINNKNLDSIADDEEFRRLVAVIDADLAEQHKTVEKMPPMGEYDLRSN